MSHISSTGIVVGSAALKAPGTTTRLVADPLRETDDASGDFEEFFTRRPRLIRVARKILADPADAEDVVQEVLAKIYARWSEYRGLKHLDSYAYRMVTNACISHHRRVKRRPEYAHTPEDMSELAQIEDDSSENRDAMLMALRQISPKQRAVLVLRYYEGMSDTEIAQTLGMRTGTVSSHATRGLQALRERAFSAGNPLGDRL